MLEKDTTQIIGLITDFSEFQNNNNKWVEIINETVANCFQWNILFYFFYRTYLFTNIFMPIQVLLNCASLMKGHSIWPSTYPPYCNKMRLFVALILLPTDYTVVLDHFDHRWYRPLVSWYYAKNWDPKKVLNRVLTGPKIWHW